jgi:hypothetical protein
VFDEPLETSNSIFKFAESSDAPINSQLQMRILRDQQNRDFEFESLLVGEDGKLICYRQNGDLRSVWKKGNNNEIQIPSKIGDDWDIPNSWYFNIKHENNKNIKLSEMFRHFRTIIQSQKDTNFYSSSENYFYAMANPNIGGVGGTIKEHNDNLDILASITLLKVYNPIEIFEFIEKVTKEQHFFIENAFLNYIKHDINASFTTVTDAVITKLENDNRYNKLFGDSTSSIALRGLLSSAAVLGIVEPFTPTYSKINDDIYFRHINGNISKIAFERGVLSSLFKEVATDHTIADNPNDVLPPVQSNSELLLRYVKNIKMVEVYKVSGGQWEYVDLNQIYAEVLLDIENKLYDLIASEPLYDFNCLFENSKFIELSYEHFKEYANKNIIAENPLANFMFDPSDPFTWNYYNTEIVDGPLAGSTGSDVNIGSWQGLYKEFYGTSYPHMEPWKLQGYNTKPLWWDTYYSGSNRKWTIDMWNNIIAGIVPEGELLPSEEESNGDFGEVTQYSYVPVNIEDIPTLDGVESDGLIPPYWDSNNSTNSNVRGLFQKNIGQNIISPNAPFMFGQEGYSEIMWKESIDYVYDVLKIAFRLDPMRLIHRIFGNNYVNVDCLQVEEESQKVYTHEDTIFHGTSDENGNIVYKPGLLEWMTHYMRFNGFDSGITLYRDMWKKWDINLSYLFKNVINTETVEIRNESVDITNRDYDLQLKNTDLIDSKDFKALNVKVLRTPPNFITDREESEDWTFSVEPLSPNSNQIEYYLPEAFPFKKVEGSLTEFELYKYSLLGASISLPKGYTKFSYNKNLRADQLTQLTPNNNYSIRVVSLDNNTINEDISVSFSIVPTVQEVLDELNNQLNGVSARVELGNIIFYSGSTGSNSQVEIIDLGLMSTLNSYLMSTVSDQTDYKFQNEIVVPISSSTNFNIGDKIEIINSENFNGFYTILKTNRNIDKNLYHLIVRPEDDVILTNDIVDGEVVPQESRTLPWETGQEVFFSTTGQLPGSLLNYIPYYIIKLDDYTFKIAETKALADNGTAIEFTDYGNGVHKVGRVRNTFKALNGKVDYPWRRMFYDKRQTYSLIGPKDVSGIQNIIDLTFGYDEYLQDNGIFTENKRLDNIDSDTGRGNDWQVEIEKFIDWVFTLLSIKEQDRLSIDAEVNPNNNSFTSSSGIVPWQTGAKVTLTTTNNGEVPLELDNVFSNFIPYYVIRTTEHGIIQLATSERNALLGKAISFSTGQGTIRISGFRKQRSVPSTVLNPFIKQFNVSHDMGILGNFMDSSEFSLQTDNTIYDQKLETLNLKDLVFFRYDKESKVRTVDESKKEIYGAELSINGLEHILKFNNYSTDNVLLYDPFLGINTPRFFIEFVKPLENTMRPSLSGMVLDDDNFTDSIEKSVSDIRNYYDTYKEENEPTTIEARRTIGYEGAKDYMTNLGINKKSQFIFWKGFIQSKGTNKAVEAFANQREFADVSVDEFWAYRQCNFGDTKLKVYPEMNLITDDVVRKELRLEFISPTGGGIGGPEFTTVRLSDRDRWRNQPELIQQLPDSTFYFTARVQELLENPTLDTGLIGNVINLTKPADGVLIQFTDPSTQEEVNAFENIHYRIINAYSIEILMDSQDYSDLKVSTFTYNYDEEHPSKIIDKSRVERVVADVPIWNPAYGHHNPIGRYPIDLTQSDDPAKYNNIASQNTEKDFWADKEVGTIWFDNSETVYKPYFDIKVYPTIQERSLKWGELADFANVKLYQWIKTNIPPEEYDSLSNEQDNNKIIPMSERITGETRKVVYKNVSQQWVEDKFICEETNKASFNINSMDRLFEKFNDLGEYPLEIEIYVNGIYDTNYEILNDNISTVSEIATILTGYEDQDYVALVSKVHEPTDEELDEEEYLIHIPHTKITSYNNENNERINTYYYWVRGLKNEKLLNNTSLTLFDAEREMKEMTQPYMFLDAGGVRYSEEGYGILFGVSFDAEDLNLPVRFSQCVVKGLKSTVKDNNRYVLRFVKNYILRDHLNESDLSLKNRHWQWKLFRRNQPFKIDEHLWIKLIESAIGFKVNSEYEIDFETPVPSLERITYDNFVNGEFTTRIGLKEDQVLADQEVTLNTIISTLLDKERCGGENQTEFIEGFDLSNPSSVRDMLREIYENYKASQINNIFFEVLYESIASNFEHPDFFKTSWVSIDVNSNIDSSPFSIIKVADTYPSVFCFLTIKEEEEEPEPDPQLVMSIGINSDIISARRLGYM